jgi:salicylate hydroxylase
VTATARVARPLLIAGGGIGGLAAALALAKAGFKARVLERNAAFSEAGAGIQIGPNGVAVLRALGVAEALEPKTGRPDDIRVMDARTGRMLTALPLGDTISARLGGPYWTAHRADLHAALLERAKREALIAITTGFEVDRLEATSEGVRVISVGGTMAAGAALIGADGLWSKVRGYIADGVALRPVGRQAYRAVVPVEGMPAALRVNSTGLWLARGVHCVHYPVRGSSEIAVVVIVPASRTDVGWAQTAEFQHIEPMVAGFAPDLVALLKAAPTWQSWALHDAPPLARWSNGGIALLGDAAHPVLPFLAQGGVLALEDALVLANEVRRRPENLPLALEAYAKARMQRARRVAVASRRNGQIYHLGGAPALARNAVLRATPAAQMIGQYDWLYGWTPPAPP